MNDCNCDDDMTEDGHSTACPNSIGARLAAAREEQRAACATECNGDYSCAKFTRPPLDSTPLADRIKELEAENKAFRDKQALWDEDASFYLQTLRQSDSIAALGDDLRDEREASDSLRTQLIAAEAERDTLRVQVEKLETLSKLLNGTIDLESDRAADWKTRALATAAALAAVRAQVDAARAVCVNTMALGDDDVRPADVLRAMDEAKP